jgi:hypothetical protein
VKWLPKASCSTADRGAPLEQGHRDRYGVGPLDQPRKAQQLDPRAPVDVLVDTESMRSGSSI